MVACVVGALIAAVSTAQHLRIEREGLEKKSFCAISEVIDCDIVNASSYSTFWGIPVAWWGFMTYLVIGGMAAFGAFSKKERKATVSIAWFISIASVLYTLRMAYILAAILGVVCIECIAMYVANIFVMIGLWTALRIRLKSVVRFFADYARAVFKQSSNLGFAPQIVSHAVVILCVMGLGWALMYNVEARGPDKRISLKEKINAHYMQSLYAIEFDSQWTLWGDPAGKVAIIEFSDFECPFCRLAAFNLRPSMQEFRKEVKYSFVNYPLDQSCNPYLEQSMHQKACMAAYAAKCAQERGDFWGFHDDLFRIQRNLSVEAILKLAQKRKWDASEFQACMNSDETKKGVLKEIEVARKVHISGTPSIIINGRRLKYWTDREFLQEVIREELKKAKKM